MTTLVSSAMVDTVAIHELLARLTRAVDEGTVEQVAGSFREDAEWDLGVMTWQGKSAIAAGVESSEVRLFSEAEIPWQQLAFPVVSSTLRHYFADRLQGSYPLRIEDLRWERDPTRQPTAAHEATAQSPKARSE